MKLLIYLILGLPFFSLGQDFSKTQGFCLSNDGSTFVIARSKFGSNNKNTGVVLHGWDTKTGNERFSFETYDPVDYFVTSPFFSSDDRYLLFICRTKEGNYIRFKTSAFDLQENKSLPASSLGRLPMDDMVTGVQGGRIIYRNAENALFGLDPISKESNLLNSNWNPQKIKSNSFINDVYFLEKGSVIYLTEERNGNDWTSQLILWEEDMSKPSKTITIDKKRRYLTMSVSPDEKYLIVANTILLSLPGLEEVKENDRVSSLYFTNTGGLIAVSNDYKAKSTVFKYYKSPGDATAHKNIVLEGLSSRFIEMKQFIYSVENDAIRLYNIENPDETDKGLVLKNSKSVPYIPVANTSTGNPVEAGQKFCNECGGSGSQYAQNKCSNCGGKGVKTCTRCNGGRFLYNYKGESSWCGSCGGHGSKTCWTCLGKGYQGQKSNCQKCQGTGLN